MEIASYTKIPQGGGFLFNIIPASKIRLSFSSRILTMAFLCGLAVYGIVFGIKIALVSAHLSWYFEFHLAMLTFILVIIWSFIKDTYPKSRCRSNSFIVYPNAIEINGQKINKEEIGSLTIRNTFRIRLLSTMISALPKNDIEQISYAINVKVDNKTTQLASGMDKVTAYILHSDISCILKLG